jgi:4-amino-4-deoxy-L-arabinose transferase-like glycosyltransferase
MSFVHRPSPARVSTAAAQAFPRWALFGLLAVYIVAGLFGRDPWVVGDDAEGFGVMWTMAHGSLTDWLLPNVTGEFLPQEAPLPSWVGAVFIRLLGPWLGDATAARLSAVLWIVLATAALWYATYRLARRDEAQPVAFAFGGEAAPRDYGRMLGDIAVLLLIGTIGLAPRIRDLAAEPAALAFTALAIYGLAWAIERPRRGALLAGLAVGGVALARGPVPAIFLLLAVSAGLWFYALRARRGQAVLLAGIAAVATFCVWPVAAQWAPQAARSEFFAAWSAWVLAGLGAPTLATLGWLLRNGAWYLWPLWPFAAWTLYAWRHGLRAAHIAIPGLTLVAMLAAFAVTPTDNQSSLMLLVPPLLVLAALGATTLRRATENLIDWFALVVFSLFTLAAWLYFIAFATGVPAPMARSVLRLVPGYDALPPASTIALAAACTLAWLVLAGWRLATRPPMLWRGPLLAAAGLLTLWTMVILLALPAINHVRSYAAIAQAAGAQIAAAGPRDACVATRHLPAAERAVFAYHGALKLVPPQAAADCRWLLTRDQARSALDDEPPGAPWELVWQSRWPPRSDDAFRLYRRSAP